MAKSLATVNGVIRIPGAYSSYQVQNNPGGLATTGVLFLIGESDGGPDYSQESDLETNAYGPDQLSDIVQKYKSGPLVDAFRGAVAAANDPDIVGSFSRAIPVKTNVSAKASGSLASSYATIADKGWGKTGNQIQVSVAEYQAEAGPSFSWMGITDAGVTVNIRVNGGAVVSQAVTELSATANGTLPSDIAGLSGLAGGASRGMITTVSGTLALAVNGSAITLTRSIAWDTTPSVGDSLLISGAAASQSVVSGVADANAGWYVITAATSTTVTATKVCSVGSLIAVSAASVTSTDVTGTCAYAPITPATTLITGKGKSLELIVSAGTPSSSMFYNGVTARTASTSLAPVLVTSTAEQKITLSASRASDLVSETFTVGGEIPFQIGYAGTTATVTITDTALTTTVTGGSGTSLSIDLADYTTIQALCDFISTQTGYVAAPTTAAMGLYGPENLDTVTAVKCCSSFGTVMPGRIKWDAYKLNKAIADGSQLVQLGTVADTTTAAGAGLPQVQSAFYLSGGTRGGTVDADVTAALTALEQIPGNFVVPLFSRDASEDIVDSITDAASTYTVAAVHAAAKSHVLAMSQFKRRKNRQALLSIQGAFADQQTVAANTASFRCNMPFQNVKDLSVTGSIVTYQPWMAAVKAASMQAAGFYKSVEYKGINCSGVTHDAGDFDPRNDSNIENALLAGLMPIRRLPTGGFVWVSDQTTYGKDDNFVYNSLQAVYAADTIAMTVAQRMEAAFVGQSVADVNKNIAMGYLESIMDDMLRLKLIAPSDDALKGYKNPQIRISANAMLVSAEIKLATAIDFVSINFLVAPVQQST